MTNWDDDDGYCSGGRGTCQRRAPRSARTWALRCITGQFCTREYREQVFADFVAGYRRGAHAEPGRAVQPRNQVRRTAWITPHRLGAHAARDRALRPRRRPDGRCAC